MNHERVPLDLDLPGVPGPPGPARHRAARRAPRLRPRRRALRQGAAPAPRAPPWTSPSATGVFSVESARLHGPRTDLVYRGQLHLVPRIRADLELSGAVDLGVVDRHVLRTDFGLAGRRPFPGLGPRRRLAGPAGRPALAAPTGSSTGSTCRATPATSAGTRKGVHLREVRGQRSSTAAASSTSTCRRRPAEAHAARRRSPAWTRSGSPPTSSTSACPASGAGATGEVSLRWPRGRIRA